MDVLLLGAATTLSRKGVCNLVYVNSQVATVTYRTDVSISGKGHLLFVASYAGTGTTSYKIRHRITIDGGPANLFGLGDIYSFPYTNGGGTVGGKFFAFDVPFFSSLLVETYNADTVSRVPETQIAYILS